MGLVLVAPTLAWGQSKQAFGQPGGKVARVAFIATTSPLAEITGPSPANTYVRVFVESLREHGYVEGRNLVLDMRTLAGNPERLDELVADVVRRKADVIYIATSVLVVRAAKLAGTTPIVGLVGSDLIGTSLVKTFARPGGTVTGPSADVDENLEAKRLELLVQVAPKVRRIAYIGAREEWARPHTENMRAAARRLGVTLVHLESEYSDFSEAFARLRGEDVQAVFIERSPRAYGRRQQIGGLAVASGLPSCCSQSELADHGCLFTYGADNLDLARRAASYVERILRGAKPGDLPVEAPVKFEMVINMKTARALGISVPSAILARADRVIE